MTVATALLVRADAGSKIGTGHLMRSLALANVWQENLPSARTFAGAGFTNVDSRPVQKHPCHIFELHKAATGGRESGRDQRSRLYE